MTPERFRQVRHVANLALDRPSAERRAFVAEACAGDASLYAEVDSLLEAYEEAQGQAFLETPAAGLVDGDTSAPVDLVEGALPPGTRLGAYELGAVVGRGGMGVVYRAVRADDAYRQVVAVKLIRRGLNTSIGQRRFREERQILAGLDHPGIARLLDGGTTPDGLPYFVMEYVEGEPIDAYCDGRRLGVAERLRLFQGVCTAVDHAHRSLIVHRDLKPANVLVTADGAPKLLDFGIARLVRPPGEPGAADPTVTVLRMLTPDYASPEQVRGEAVTTATDVYSLGVLLYELLCGRRPYRTTAVHEVLAAICEEDPERPSASVARTRKSAEGPAEPTAEALSGARDTTPALLRKKLAGDLDTVVLKALRKAPAERYASAEALADDVGRYLEGLPVRARPQTLGYRAGKFVRRNPVATAAAGLALASLLGGIVATWREARLADQQRQRAERRFADVRRLSNSFLFEFHDAIANLPGATPARELVVRRASEYLGSLSAEATGDRSLQRELAEAYKRVGDVQGGALMANMGDTAGAIGSYRKAIALYEAAGSADAADTPALADAVKALSLAQLTAGDLAGAQDSAARAVALSRAVLASGSSDFAHRNQLALCLLALNNVAQQRGDLAAAHDAAREAVSLLDSLHTEQPGNARIASSLAIGYWRLAWTLDAGGEGRAAAEEYGKARTIQEALLREAPQNAVYMRQLAYTYEALGWLLRTDIARAEPILRRAVELRGRLAQTDSRNADAQLNLSRTRKFLGLALALAGRSAEARPLLDQAVTFAETAAGAAPDQVQMRVFLAECYRSRSLVHRAEADRAKTPRARLAALHEEQAWLNRSRRVWADLRGSGRLSAGDRSMLQEMDDAVARSERELQLQTGTAGGR